MIFPVGLKVLRQMLDSAREKCNLHIRAAGIFLMQLELLKTQRLIALCHNEGANLDEERILATHALKSRTAASVSIPCRVSFALAVVPQTQSRARSRHTRPA